MLIEWVQSCLNLEKNYLIFKNILLNEFNEFTNDQSCDHSSAVFKSNKIAKFLLILIDSKADGIFNPILESIIERITSCNKYAYRSPGLIERTIFILDSMINIVRGKYFLFLIQI